jgi:hypothetical protein
VNHQIIPPVGGTFERTPDGAVNYLLFPPTHESPIDVVDNRVLLARVAFPPPLFEKCPLRATGPFHIVSCGSIIIADWKSRLAFQPSRVTLLDVRVTEPGVRLGVLGFYFLGVRKGSNGLIVQFGFQRPKGSRVELRAAAVFLRRDGTEAKNPLRPPVKVRFNLVAAQGI